MACAKENQETFDELPYTDYLQYDKCKKHKNQDVKFYCCDHKICGCAECFLMYHCLYKREYVIDAATRFNKEGHLENMEQKIHDLETTHTDILSAIDSLTMETDRINRTVLNEIQSCLDSMKAMIEKFECTLFEEAKTRNLENLKKITALKDDVLKVSGDIESNRSRLHTAIQPYQQFILALETDGKIKALRAKLSSIQHSCSIDYYTFLPSEGIKDLVKQAAPIGVISDVPVDQMQGTQRSIQNASDEWNDVCIELAAQRVLERPQHTVKKQTLIVEQNIPRKKTTFQRRDSASDEEIYEDADEVIKDTIKVLGVTAPIRSTVELYFENTRRSGGGDIVEILTDNEEEDVIYVKFQEVEVAERVLEREKHAVKGINLTVEQFIPVKDTVSKPKTEEQKVDKEEEELIFDTVKVSGVDPSKRSTIELYFENARRSDGGEYEKIWSDDEEEGVIYIKYLSEEVAKKVAGRSHTVQGNGLKASLYCPPKPPPSYDNKVIIKGLNESTF